MTITTGPGARLLIASLTLFWLGACSTPPRHTQPPEPERGDPLAAYSVLSGLGQEPDQSTPARSATPPDDDKPEAQGSRPQRVVGSDRFVADTLPPQPLRLSGDGLVLNFENADLRDVVRLLLGDFLKLPYVYDPRVQGKVSLQTSDKLPPEAVLATLETLLRMNGAALVPDGNGYRIVPEQEARAQAMPQLGDNQVAIPPGYRLLVVPLRYVSALQMEGLLTPIVGPKAIVSVDSNRNLLILAGSSRELQVMLETVRMFDVDWLAGMSIGLYPLEHSTPAEMITELESIFRTGKGEPLAGMVRFEPVERLNAVLVISSRAAYLEKIGRWIGRLDQRSGGGQELYVYYLQNGKAADIAKILEEVFNGPSDRRGEGRLAPGLQPVTLRAEAGKEKPATPAVPPRPAGERLEFSAAGKVRIIADEVNNALLILAGPREHKMVLAAIKKLDVVPLQVLIEATIAEVKLTDNMRFGLQWFFKSGDLSATLSNGSTGVITPDYPGFSLVFNGTDAKVILDALDQETTVNIVSSPHLMVLDNQTASLQVGDEVPVITQQQQSSVTADATLINTVEYRNTGVIMNVTPRVNSSGTIIMEVEQEVSNVLPSQNETLTPTISQRRFKSSVVVQSGDTVVLGGLIFDFTTKQRAGLPLLSKLPLVGPLFGSTENDSNRTELVMLITPRLVQDRHQAKQVTEEVRRRLRALRQLQKERIRSPVMDRLKPRPEQRLPGSPPQSAEEALSHDQT